MTLSLLPADLIRFMTRDEPAQCVVLKFVCRHTRNALAQLMYPFLRRSILPGLQSIAPNLIRLAPTPEWLRQCTCFIHLCLSNNWDDLYHWARRNHCPLIPVLPPDGAWYGRNAFALLMADPAVVAPSAHRKVVEEECARRLLHRDVPADVLDGLDSDTKESIISRATLLMRTPVPLCTIRAPALDIGISRLDHSRGRIRAMPGPSFQPTGSHAVISIADVD
jgi:hypothetical protein